MSPSELDPLRRRDLHAARDEALSALRRASQTNRERAALELVLKAHAEERAPEALLVEAAQLFLQRGEASTAARLLDGRVGGGALLLAADIATERGEFMRALALVERVIARDVDAPGARERHARLSERLGRGMPEPFGTEEPTLLRADLPETNLRVLGEAGRGGAGTVYQAFDHVLDRNVALKVYHRPAVDRPKLEREARIAVELAGRGVIRVFDVNPGHGLLVMEWIPRGALKGWLRRSELDLLWPLRRWFVPLLESVARVHERGFIHADLKPANVLFRAVDEPVLSDFGLALERGQRLTGGSLGYLSPERLLNQRAEPADDVYALGRILEDALLALQLGRDTPGTGTRPHGSRLCMKDLAPWRNLARLATSSGRPPDAAALLERALNGAGFSG